MGGDLDTQVTTDALGLGAVPKERTGRDRSRAGLQEAAEGTGSMSGKAVGEGLERRGKEQRGPQGGGGGMGRGEDGRGWALKREARGLMLRDRMVFGDPEEDSFSEARGQRSRHDWDERQWGQPT